MAAGVAVARQRRVAVDAHVGVAAAVHQAPHVPAAFVPRPLDENCWNACVATALGRAYLAASDSVFLRGHAALTAELESRLGAMSGTASATRPVMGLSRHLFSRGWPLRVPARVAWPGANRFAFVTDT